MFYILDKTRTFYIRLQFQSDCLSASDRKFERKLYTEFTELYTELVLIEFKMSLLANNTKNINS